MFASSISLLLLALLFRSVEAGIRFNAPNGNTTWDASKPQYIKWRESGSADNRTTLQQLGSLSVTLWAGSSTGGKSQVAAVGLLVFPKLLSWLSRPTSLVLLLRRQRNYKSIFQPVQARTERSTSLRSHLPLCPITSTTRASE